MSATTIWEVLQDRAVLASHEATGIVVTWSDEASARVWQFARGRWTEVDTWTLPAVPTSFEEARDMACAMLWELLRDTGHVEGAAS